MLEMFTMASYIDKFNNMKSRISVHKIKLGLMSNYFSNIDILNKTKWNAENKKYIKIRQLSIITSCRRKLKYMIANDLPEKLNFLTVLSYKTTCLTQFLFLY